jgi:hypothetical protein
MDAVSCVFGGVEPDEIDAGMLTGRGAEGVTLGVEVGRGAIVVGALTPSPRKSFTRVSTSWLIEMLFASQKAFSRS